MVPVAVIHREGKLATHTKLTAQKRMRERSRQEWQKEKAARRDEAKARKQSAPTAAEQEARDLAGIVPGPQPSPWDDEPRPSADSTAKKDDGPA
jgi:hypothetical protein